MRTTSNDVFKKLEILEDEMSEKKPLLKNISDVDMKNMSKT